MDYTENKKSWMNFLIFPDFFEIREQKNKKGKA